MDQHAGFIYNLSHRRKVISQHRLPATDTIHHRRHTGGTWPAGIECALPIECFGVFGIDFSVRFSQRLHSRVLWVDQRRPQDLTSKLDEGYLIDVLTELAKVPTEVPLGADTFMEPDDPKLVHYVQKVCVPS